MRSFLILFLVSLCASCEPRESILKEIEFYSFTLQTPSNWSSFEGEGIDAYMGGLTNGQDSLWFYYGRFINGPEDEDAKTHLFAQDTVNGFVAMIVIPRTLDTPGTMQLFIPYAPDNAKFALSSNNVQDTQTILKIFKSVSFDRSDTLKNGKLSTVNFQEYPLGSGRSLYVGLCSSCHQLNRGTDELPALVPRMVDKDVKWLTQFLQSNAPISRNDTLVNEYHLKIRWFDSLTTRDFQQLTGYIKGEN